MNAIFTRTSVRQFEDREVEPEKIEQLLKAGFAAPSALNERPWEFYVIRNKGTLATLSKTNQYARPVANAPVAIVICYNTSTLKSLDFVDINCAIAAENIWLEMEELELGGVFMAIRPFEARVEFVTKALNLPENIVPFGIIPFGYPKSKRQQKERFNADRVHYVD